MFVKLGMHSPWVQPLGGGGGGGGATGFLFSNKTGCAISTGTGCIVWLIMHFDNWLFKLHSVELEYTVVVHVCLISGTFVEHIF